MYRESLPGLALAATIEELGTMLALTEAQKAQLWEVFDRTMESCLAEAPIMSRVKVTCPPPSVHDLATPTAGRRVSVGDGSTDCRADKEKGTAGRAVGVGVGSSSGSIVAEDCDVPFPVYRRVGDMWTILLKNPTVEVRDEFGVEEKLQLDYLRVRLRDGTRDSGATAPKRKRARKS